MSYAALAIMWVNVDNLLLYKVWVEKKDVFLDWPVQIRLIQKCKCNFFHWYVYYLGSVVFTFALWQSVSTFEIFGKFSESIGFDANNDLGARRSENFQKWHF